MYSRKYIDIITLAIVTIIFILINIYQIQTQSNIKKVLEQTQTISNQEILLEENNEDDTEIPLIENDIEDDIEIPLIETVVEEDDVPRAISSSNNWSIFIPIIDLVAPIKEGTSEEILNQYVGHFEESPKNNGNICLAAHNRGYDVNYFQNLKKLLLNDVIIYKYENIERKYAVSNITIIKETDWSYIESSNENKLTLITCIENEPEYRLCVQATEIK